MPGRGDQHQRHAHLRPRPVRGGDRGVPRRPGAVPGRRRGPDPDRLGASLFVSRVDTQTDRRLDRLAAQAENTERAQAACRLRGRAAIANARLAYAAYEELSSPRWRELAAAGARPQRPLWASTGVKDPAYPDTRYVTELVAPGTVNTMPEATLRAVADHGQITGDTIHGTYPQPRATLQALTELGIDYDDVVSQLERDGVQWLIAIGVLGALAAALIGLLDMLGIPTGTPAFRTALVHRALNWR